MGRTRSRVRWAAAATAAVMALAAQLAVPASAAAPKRVHYYGDSLLTEAHWELAAKFAAKPGWALSQTFSPGAPLCFFGPIIEQDLASEHPYRIVIQSYGNARGPCIDDSDGNPLAAGSPEWLAHYQQDLETILEATDAAGVRVTLVQSPAADFANLNTAEQELDALRVSEAAAHHKVSIAVAPATAVEKNQMFTFTKACTAAEKANPTSGCGTPKKGQILIRAPDGVHFCPVGYPEGEDSGDGCAVYSSGAVRFGDALVTAGTAPPKPVNP